MFVFTYSILKSYSSSSGARPPPSFFQTLGAFMISIIEIEIFQCVVSEKTGLQAHAHSTLHSSKRYLHAVGGPCE